MASATTMLERELRLILSSASQRKPRTAIPGGKPRVERPTPHGQAPRLRRRFPVRNKQNQDHANNSEGHRNRSPRMWGPRARRPVPGAVNKEKKSTSVVVPENEEAITKIIGKNKASHGKGKSSIRWKYPVVRVDDAF